MGPQWFGGERSIMNRLDFSKLAVNAEDPFQMALRSRVETYNRQPGADDGTGIRCPECRDRGTIAFISPSGSFTVRPCKCAGHRRTVKRLQRQGLYERAKRATLDSFRTDTALRKAMKQTVEDFLRCPEPHWLALCGQSGTGKTHLCTAAFARLSSARGLEGRYLLWNSDARQIKNEAANGDETALKDFKTCGLLYIDDLFKTRQGAEPSDADVRLAFELLDWRYNNRLVTILSTERQGEELRKLDFALYRRICEMCGPYLVSIAPDQSKCYVPQNTQGAGSGSAEQGAQPETGDRTK